MLTLRDYQQQAINDVRKGYQDGFRAPLLVAPTGAGKTVIFSYVAATAAARGKRVLILVHRIELLRQTSKKLSEAGVSHGLINPKYSPRYYEPVQVASVQTLINRLDKLPTPDLIVIDEAHHVAGMNTWAKVLNHFAGALKLGVTATPVRGDGHGLGLEAGGWFDVLVNGPQTKWLIEQGYLVKPTIFGPRNKIDLAGVKITRGDYEAKALQELMDKPSITGDAVDHYRRLCPGAPAVVFCVSISHAQHVAEEFRRAGFRAYHADGSMDDETRSAILNGLGNNTVDVVTTCDLISEGTDIPAISCAILLRPTESLGLFIQQVGRALRPVYAPGYDLSTTEGRLAAVREGKGKVYILDHVGNIIRHGFPDDERAWFLEGTKKNNGKAKAEPTIRVAQCPSCYAIHLPGPTCTTCGHVYPVTQLGREIAKEDGDLREMTEADRFLIKRQQARAVAQARTLQELEKIAVERGYKPGWAKHVFESRQKKLAAGR